MLSTKESIGRMDKRVTFQKPIYGTDASNQHKITGWQDIDTSPEVAANVEFKSGSEGFESDQLVATKTATITVRYRTDLSTNYRAIVGDEIFNIHSIIEVGRKRFSKILGEFGGQYKETTT